MQKPWILICPILVVCLVGFVACAGGDDDPRDALEAAAADMKKSGEDLAKAVENVIDEATGDIADAVQGTIDEIKAAIAEKEEELQAVKDKLAEMSPADLAGDGAAKLKDESEGLMEELRDLKNKIEAALDG